MVARFFPNLDQMSKLYTEPSICTSYQISINLANHKQELPMAVILVARSRNMAILSRIFDTSFLQINYLLCLLVSEEKIFLISANKKQELYYHKNEEKLNMDSKSVCNSIFRLQYIY
jgi:hypothetical protein